MSSRIFDTEAAPAMSAASSYRLKVTRAQLKDEEAERQAVRAAAGVSLSIIAHTKSYGLAPATNAFSFTNPKVQEEVETSLEVSKARIRVVRQEQVAQKQKEADDSAYIQTKLADTEDRTIDMTGVKYEEIP